MGMAQTSVIGCMSKIIVPGILAVLKKGTLGQTYCIGGAFRENQYGSNQYDLLIARREAS